MALIRVLHVIATLDPAGAETQMAHLCRRVDRSEFLPAVCCLTRGGPLEQSLRSDAVRVDVLHKRGHWDVSVMGGLLRVIRRFRPHILHTWLPTANTLGRIAGLAAGVPVLIASERAADVWKGWFRRWTDRVLALRTDLIITNAEAVKGFLVRRIGLPKGIIGVIPNGLEIVDFDAALRQGPTAPLPVRSHGPVVGTVARLEPQKGITYLIDAFRQLPPDMAHVRLWVIGAGVEESRLRNQAAAAGLAGRIHFLGHRSDVPGIMARLDLFVLPSLWEGLPNVVLEAMAARRAVVATAVDGTPEAVAQGETGLLVPPADASALAGAMASLLRDHARRTAFGEAGRRRVEKAFSMRRMVSETQAVYRQALAGRRSHG